MTNPIKPSLASLRNRPEQTSGLSALTSSPPLVGALTSLSEAMKLLPKQEPVLGALDAHMRAVKTE